MLYKRKQKTNQNEREASKKYIIAKTTKNYKKSISVKKKANKQTSQTRQQQTKHEKKTKPLEKKTKL